jgi:aminoglycoside phosphotransferase (APT) family kinase protein
MTLVTASATNPELMTERLRRVVLRSVPGASGVANLRAVTGGASQAIWSFDAIGAQIRVPLVMRCAQQWSADGQAGSAGMAAEAALLQVAGRHGVPVPGVRALLRADDALGEGYVMDRIDGETQGRRIVADPSLAEVRLRLAGECGAIMARIHSLSRAELPALRTGFAIDEAESWAARHRANGSARPVVEWALRWLRENAPAPVGDAVLVHGDFRNGNLVVGPDGVRAVLDWELAHLGDPMEDLGWFCVNAWRFGRVNHAAGGFGSREALVEGYEAAGGQRVDLARVHYWEVLGTLKWGVTCDGMGLAFSSGTDRSLERAAVGRRASEAEIDLLYLLAPTR